VGERKGVDSHAHTFPCVKGRERRGEGETLAASYEGDREKQEGKRVIELDEE